MGPLRCVVEIDVKRVTAPGVWRRGDVCLSITLFGHTGWTGRVYPDHRGQLDFYEKFTFEKTYYTAVDTADVKLFLEDELIKVELLQTADFGTCDVVLASYVAPALDFLYPYRSIWPSFSSGLSEIFLTDKTEAYPLTTMSPRVEFTSYSVIRDGLYTDTLLAPEVTEITTRRSRSRSRSLPRVTSRPLSRSRSLKRIRSRSPSPLRSILRRSRYDTTYGTGYSTDSEVAALTSSYVRPRSVSPYRFRQRSVSPYRSWLRRPLSPVTTYRYRYSPVLDDMVLDTDRSYLYNTYLY